MDKYDDPIVKEVHETRERLLAKFGSSDGYAEHLREVEETLKEHIVMREPRRPRDARPRKIS